MKPRYVRIKKEPNVAEMVMFLASTRQTVECSQCSIWKCSLSEL